MINFSFCCVVQVLMKSKIASRRIYRRNKSEVFDISCLFRETIDKSRGDSRNYHRFFVINLN